MGWPGLSRLVPVLPLLGCAHIAAVDLTLSRWALPVPVMGVLDWSAHLSTSALALLALAGTKRLAERPCLTATALGCSLLIDLDHLPLYLGLHAVAPSGGRPVTHSLVTPLLLLVIARGWSRSREIASAAAAGVLLHFVRDIVTGPGLLLRWPFSAAPTLLGYAWYVALVAGLAGIAVVRLSRAARRGPPGASATPGTRSRSTGSLTRSPGSSTGRRTSRCARGTFGLAPPGRSASRT